MKKLYILIACATALCGCQTRITATKNAESVLPKYAVKDGVPYIVGYDKASGGWEATARSPLWATESLQGLSIAVTTNGTVELSLANYDRDLSTNAVVVTEKLIDGAVELTAKVTAAIVTSGGSAAASSASSAVKALVAKFIAAGGNADNAKIECSDGSCTITDGSVTCKDGSCYPSS